MIYISEGPHSLFLYNPTQFPASLELRYNPFEILQPEVPVLQTTEANFNALLGVKFIEQIPFLMVAADVTPCSSFQGSTIMQIKSVDFLPVVPQHDRVSALRKAESKIREFEKLFDGGHHYYSDNYRLYLPYHLNQQQSSPQQTAYYEQFIFNLGAIRCTSNPLFEQWCRPIIQGYIESYNSFLPTHERVFCTIISRRSNKKAGTRYYARGIDDKGNVANFTETEQIVEFRQFCISHLQIRGSVPAFFEQLGISGLSGELNIVRNEATTQKAFESHFEKLHREYGQIFCVNLLSVKKSDEKKLTLFFESLINKYSPKHVRYQFFDFHEECKNNKFENADILVRQIREVIDYFDCNIVNINTKQVLRKQNGVMRTNCLDCLDRTNYVQSRISLYLMEKVIINLSPPQLRELIIRQSVFINRHEESSDLMQKFNSSWAENGDSISLHYTGTGSTHTDITKNGKRTLKGTVHHKVKSLMRFFVQFTDTQKHEAINEMVHNPLLRASSIKEQPEDFEFLNAVLLSFQIPKDEDSKANTHHLFTEDYVARKRPSIVVVFGFFDPETSVLDWLRLNKKDSKEVDYFCEQKTYTIRRLGYELFSEVKNESSCLLIFGDEVVLPNLSQIKQETLGKHKDTLHLSKFYIFNTPMVFSGVNCSKFQNFVDLLEKSHEEAFQFNRLGQARSSSILTHHYRTVLGDIASKSQLPEAELEELKKQLEHIRKQKDEKNEVRLINRVLDNDLFSKSSHENLKYVKNYMEGPAHFIPESNRIVFWNMENLIVKVLEYKHLPGQRCIYGHFSYELKRVSRE